MKKALIFSALLGAAVTFSSCDDFLTENVRGQENLDTYFQSEEEVESFVGGCYFELTKMGWWQIYNAWLMSDMTTDDMWDGNTTQTDGYQDVTHFLPIAPASGILQNFWGARYQGINTCNIGIERTENAPVSEEVRNRAVAQMRFLRAFFYFDLVRNFGGVPMITKQMGSTSGIPRSSEEDCYSWIEEELSFCAANLPQKSEWSQANTGRATRGAALGILGKAQLYQGKWAEAKATLKTIIDEGQYELMPEFGQVWSVNTNNNQESLFEAQTMYGGDQYALGGSLTVVTGCRNGIGDGWSWGQPSSDLENAFIAAGDTERLRWSIIKTGCKEIAGESDFPAFVRNNSTVFSGGTTDAKYVDYKKTFGWNDYMFISTYIIDPAQHKSARIIRKYFVPLADRPEIYNIDKIPLNHRILRYADVLLMYAEASNETGDDASAREALNQVRRRVNLADVTASGNELRKAIRAERRLELAFEQCRLYDIRRWTADNGKKEICNIMGPNGSFVLYNTGANADPYEAWNQGEPSDKGIRFTEPRDLLWPIPTYEIQHSNGAIEQNPGW